jgi:uncharacterized membrane protein
MKAVLDFIRTTVIGGLLVIVPVVITFEVLARLVHILIAALRPLTDWLPPWMPFANVVAVAIIVAICFVAGVIAKTQIGTRIAGRLEQYLERVPGYVLFRTIVRRVGGAEESEQFAVALVEIEDGLCPAFLVEEHDDGQWTVFVPAVPTPTMGSIYIFPKEKVHRVDVPFTVAVRCVTHWGSGSRELLRHIRRYAPANVEVAT